MDERTQVDEEFPDELQQGGYNSYEITLFPEFKFQIFSKHGVEFDGFNFMYLEMPIQLWSCSIFRLKGCSFGLTRPLPLDQGSALVETLWRIESLKFRNTDPLVGDIVMGS
ncbi:hypothetical protein NPIL_497211 [Nephila pilipes]|uniref:Uncharacterized protein n=1 Tax=Nephila pilipes TaxID=299642 RepID=A0A8X6MFP5_NEPPI|nr:hypothetical protein NPIL_497211 [Nephila pilipes]